MSTKHSSLSSALRALLLSLLLWSAVFPAHLQGTVGIMGRWVELCTTVGAKTLWVADQSSPRLNTIDPTAADTDTNSDPTPNPHAQPHCPWCLFSLPALAMLIFCAFFIPRFSHAFVSADGQHIIATTTLWLWACPRAPPKPMGNTI